jgi:hypothetical protein
MRETGGLHVGNSALNITSKSTARPGYSDRTEAGDRNRDWHRDGSDSTRDRCRDIAMVLRVGRIITIPMLMMLRMCFAPRCSAPHIVVF